MRKETSPTASAPSACQSLADALVATWSAAKAVANETCGRMYVGRQTGTEAQQTLHQISSDMQLLPSRELFKRQLQDSDSHETSEQVAGLQSEAAAAAARGGSDA